MAAIQKELKTSSARTMASSLRRRHFSKVFGSWRRYVTEELLDRSLIEGLVVVEQSSELDRSAAIMKQLREDLESRNQEIATLLAENSALKRLMYDAKSTTSTKIKVVAAATAATAKPAAAPGTTDVATAEIVETATGTGAVTKVAETKDTAETKTATEIDSTINKTTEV